MLGGHVGSPKNCCILLAPARYNMIHIRTKTMIKQRASFTFLHVNEQTGMWSVLQWESASFKKKKKNMNFSTLNLLKLSEVGQV